jgi:hypothetical protein
LEKNYKLKNYSLFQIPIDLSNIKVCTDCPYTDAGVRVLTLTNYGMKIPLSSSLLYQKSSLLEAWFPFSSHYPPNSFDISFTIHSTPSTRSDFFQLPDLQD